VTYNGRTVENVRVESARRTLQIHEATQALAGHAEPSTRCQASPVRTIIGPWPPTSPSTSITSPGSWRA